MNFAYACEKLSVGLGWKKTNKLWTKLQQYVDLNLNKHKIVVFFLILYKLACQLIASFNKGQ